MTGLEVEFKYSADNISLESFSQFCRLIGESEYKSAAGYDYFYENGVKGSFLRHRVGPDINQLTYKRKIQKDNFIRVERNINLHRDILLEEVTGFCEDTGYKFNTKIMKHSFVFVFDWYIAAYYICYDANMEELNRFIELEVREDMDNKDPYKELLILEKMYKPLGLMPNDRVKASLFELYRKEV